MKNQTSRNSVFPVICLIIGATGGFASGQWRGKAVTLRVYASAQAPGVDPLYANALSDDAVYRARAPMAVEKR
jgi:hypothetical protein